MTDDIQWYPLPEVLDETQVVVDVVASSCDVISTSSSHRTSPSYLTPASSVASFRGQQRHTNNPHLTGTVQPYLKKQCQQQQKSEERLRLGAIFPPKHSHSSMSHSLTKSSSSSVYTTGSEGSLDKHSTVSVSTSSLDSVVVKKTSSAPSLKTSQSTNVSGQQSITSQPPDVRVSSQQSTIIHPQLTTNSQHPVSSQQNTIIHPQLTTNSQHPVSKQQSTTISQPSVSKQQSTTISQPSVSRQQSTTISQPSYYAYINATSRESTSSQQSMSGKTIPTVDDTLSTPPIKHLPHTTLSKHPRGCNKTESPLVNNSPITVTVPSNQQSTPSITSTVETSSSQLPSDVFIAAPNHHPPSSKPQTTISLAELEHLWMDFLTSYLDNARVGGHQLENRPVSATTSESCGHKEVKTGSTVTRDTAIQTTPSLAMSISSGSVQLHQLSLEQCTTAQKTSRLSRLTLQESLKTLRPDFVQRSEQRQRELKRNQELLFSHAQCSTTTPVKSRCHHKNKRPSSRPSSSRPTSRDEKKITRPPHFIPIDVTKNRPKMSPVEIYHNSKRYWCKLPEVQQKIQEQKRESEAATNRLRMKLYQQQVLERLRQKKK